MCSGRADNIILVHTVAANPDCADQLTITIEGETARKNRDPVWKSWVRCEGGIQDELREGGPNEPRELLLQSIVGTRVLHIQARRIKALREESDGARREG